MNSISYTWVLNKVQWNSVATFTKVSMFRLNDIFHGITTIKSAYFKLLVIIETNLHSGSRVTCKCVCNNEVLKPKRAEDKDRYNTLHLSVYIFAQSPYKEWTFISPNGSPSDSVLCLVTEKNVKKGNRYIHEYIINR